MSGMIGLGLGRDDVAKLLVIEYDSRGESLSK